MQSLSERLAFIRGLAGLRPRKLSVLAGLHPTHARLIETGAREDPSSSASASLARVFGVEPGWLIDGIGPLVASRPDLDTTRPDDLAAITAHVRAAVAEALARHAAPDASELDDDHHPIPLDIQAGAGV